MDLTTQKRLAADILKVGVSRIRIDPAKSEEVSRAITRDDIKHFISNGSITVAAAKGNSRSRYRANLKQKKKGRRRGYGSRTGNLTARSPSKIKWINKVRALRDELRKLRKEKKINEEIYRETYKKIKGNLYHSRRHLRENLGVGR